MAFVVDGYPYQTFKERLTSIPLPKVYWTDKEWRSEVISELRPYFILPKADYATFLRWMNDEFAIREVTSADLKAEDLKHEIQTYRKGHSDPFWLLEKNEASRIFYETAFRAGEWTSEEYYDDAMIVIGYNEEIDEFYSNSNFLEHVLAYFRGINEEDLRNDTPSLYPIRTALAYASNLHAVLEEYSGYRGIQMILRALHTDTLVVSGLNGRKATVSGEVFLPVFRQIFASDDIHMDTHYPEPEDGEKYQLAFTEADGKTISLTFAGGRLYFEERGRFELEEEKQQLSNWILEILS